VKAVMRAWLAAVAASASTALHSWLTANSSWSASAVAEWAADARTRSPAGRGESTKTASVPTAEASQNPSSRDGTKLIAAGEAAGKTKVSMAAVAPMAALGPAMPANRTQNVTTRVTAAAIAAFDPSEDPVLTAVPITISTVPVHASPK
jgi:hypothetical protein